MTQRIYCLNTWRESPFYSEPERAALELTEVVTISIGLLQARKSAHGILRLRRFPLKGAILVQGIVSFLVIILNNGIAYLTITA